LACKVRAEIGQDARYAHSVRVARCAEILARHYGADTAKARVAGLLHDLARLYAPARLLDECARRGIAIGEAERRRPVLLHAALSAELARERFGVSDPDVLSAIAKHTLGDEEMSPLDCAVFLADSLEPGREFPEREALWHLARSDMRDAMRATLAAGAAYLRGKGIEPAERALAAERAFSAEPLLDAVRGAALEKKGEEFVAIDVRGRTILADTFALVTGRSRVQVRSIAEAVVEAAERAGVRAARIEGYAEGGWMLIDLGSVVVHVFTPEQRAFYNLERLWLPTERKARTS
jgi:ribosome silencing factor RsfS/YbeB/iojap